MGISKLANASTNRNPNQPSTTPVSTGSEMPGEAIGRCCRNTCGCEFRGLHSPLRPDSMKRRTCPIKALLLCLALLVVCSAVFFGQEIEDRKDESTKTEKEKESDKAVADVIAGRRIFLPSDSLSRATDRTLFETRHPNLQPTTFVDFASDTVGSRKIEFTTNYTYGRFNVGDLNRSDELYNDLDSFVLSGSFTKEDLDW